MAVKALLGDVKLIDTMTKQIVFGFIKQAQLLFPNDNIYYTIPLLVSHWTLLYYHQNERFDAGNCGKTYILSSGDTVLTKAKESENGVAYLETIVHTGLHHWRFKLLNANEAHYTITIGCWKHQYEPEIERFAGLRQTAHKCYAYIVTQCQLLAGNSAHRRSYGEHEYSTDDVIDMYLDLDNRLIRYCVNDHDLGVAYRDIEQTSYRAAIDMYAATDCVELLLYERVARK